MFSGKKTYIAAALAVLAALVAYFQFETDLHETLQAVFLALGLGSLRWGVGVTEAVNDIANIDRLRTSAAGSKWITYMAALATVATAVFGVLSGEQDLMTAIQVIVGALGVGFLGSGVEKGTSVAGVASTSSSQ